MMHKVIKPFPFAGDGYTSERLNVGDVRDFGRAADGLVGEGYVEPETATKAPVVEPIVEVPSAPAENVEKSVEPPRRGRRRN